METLEYAVIAGLIAGGRLVYASGWGTTLLNRLTAVEQPRLMAAVLRAGSS